MGTLRRTPLFGSHQKLGARMVDFGGWEMPVQYSGIVDEHLAVRRNAGVFDISHMGEFSVNGPDALAFLNRMLTNDLRKLTPGQGQYTLMCNEGGGTIDDLYAYRLAENEFLLVVNASRIEADFNWINSRLRAAPANVKLRDASEDFGALAVQGPRVVEFIDRCFPRPSSGGTIVARVADLKKNQFGVFDAAGSKAYVARTGYTGEDGFEVIAPVAGIEAVWNSVLAEGHAQCLQPCGLGARDTLRTEVCYPLYGHELNETTSPIEAGLGFFVALDKGDFIGCIALAEQRANARKKCVAFKMIERSAPPRPDYPIWSGPERIGVVTSGTQSPSLGVGIGLGYVTPAAAKAGTPIEIEIRGKRAAAVVVAKPLYRKATST